MPEATQRPGRLRRIALACFLIVVSILIALLVAEVLTRLIFADRVNLFPRYHSVVHYGDYTLRRLRPNTTFDHTSRDGRWEFVTNAQGFRDEEDYAYEKRPGEFRVLVLGDSHTQGFEVRQSHTFAAVSERALARDGYDAEVLNTGISGFGTAEQFLFLREEGLKYRPDAVVLGFFANDFDDVVKANLFALRDGQLVETSRAHAPAARILDAINSIFLIRWLSENSYFYSLLFNTAWEMAKRALLTQREYEMQAEYAIATEAVDDYKQNLTVALVEAMHELCRKAGILFIIADIPQEKDGRLVSSVPEKIKPMLRRHSDAFIDSEALLGRFDTVVETHLPHGQRHISEFSHALIGVEIAELVGRSRPPASN